MKGFILLILAIILFIPLSLVGFAWSIVEAFINRQFKDGFEKVARLFYTSALAIDQLGNVICQELFNDSLIKEKGYKFGNPDETISSVLGKNKLEETLTKGGKALDWILNLIDKNHTIKSIEKNV